MCTHTVKTHNQHLWWSCRQHRMQDCVRRWCHGRWSGDLWRDSGQLSKGEVGDINAPEDRTDKRPWWRELGADGSLENGCDRSARWQKWPQKVVGLADMLWEEAWPGLTSPHLQQSSVWCGGPCWPLFPGARHQRELVGDGCLYPRTSHDAGGAALSDPHLRTSISKRVWGQVTHRYTETCHKYVLAASDPSL